MKSVRFMILSTILVPVLTLAACTVTSPPAQVASPPPPPPAASLSSPSEGPVSTVVVSRGTVAETILATARVVSERESGLYFRTSGQVGEVLVKEGDQVKEGAILAELVDRVAQQQASTARLELETSNIKFAKAQEEARNTDLADAQASIDLASLNMQNAQLKLNKLKRGPAQEEVNAAKGEIERARVELQRAQAAYDPVAWNPDVAARRESADLQSATIDYNLALAKYEAKMVGPSKEDIALAENEIKAAEIELAKARATYTQRRSAQSLARFDVQLSEMDVARSRLALDNANRQVADSRIVATFSGKITSIMTKSGDQAVAFNPVIKLADPKGLDVVLDLDNSSLNRLAVGQKVTVSFGQTNVQVFQGEVVRVPGPVDSSSNSDKSVHVQLTSTSGLALGMQGKASITLQNKDNTLLVSREAVRSSGNRSYVRMQKGDMVEQIDIRMGIQSEDLVEVLSGLKEGDQVLGR